MNEEDQRFLEATKVQVERCILQTQNQHTESLEFSDRYLVALYKTSLLEFQAPANNPRDFSQRLSIIAGATQNMGAITDLIREGKYAAACVQVRWEIEIVGSLIWFQQQHPNRYGRGGSYRALPEHWRDIYTRLSEIAHFGRNREGFQEVMGLLVGNPENNAANFNTEFKPEWAEPLLHYHLELQSLICNEAFNLINETQPEVRESVWYRSTTQISTDVQEWENANNNPAEQN